jgi:hypothetical protein
MDLSGNDGVDDWVDSLWMVTMNSDQEDKKILWILNNERIWLGGQVKMVIEVDNLTTISVTACRSTVLAMFFRYSTNNVCSWTSVLHYQQSKSPCFDFHEANIRRNVFTALVALILQCL